MRRSAGSAQYSVHEGPGCCAQARARADSTPAGRRSSTAAWSRSPTLACTSSSARRSSWRFTTTRARPCRAPAPAGPSPPLLPAHQAQPGRLCQRTSLTLPAPAGACGSPACRPVSLPSSACRACGGPACAWPVTRQCPGTSGRGCSRARGAVTLHSVCSPAAQRAGTMGGAAAAAVAGAHRHAECRVLPGRSARTGGPCSPCHMRCDALHAPAPWVAPADSAAGRRQHRGASGLGRRTQRGGLRAVQRQGVPRPRAAGARAGAPTASRRRRPGCATASRARSAAPRMSTPSARRWARC